MSIYKECFRDLVPTIMDMFLGPKPEKKVYMNMCWGVSLLLFFMTLNLRQIERFQWRGFRGGAANVLSPISTPLDKMAWIY